MSPDTGGMAMLAVQASYLVAATLFLLGLQRMASPLTARSGIRWAGAGSKNVTTAKGVFCRPSSR